MQWNPFLNAFGASAYIWCIALFFQFIESVRSDTPDTFFDPIAALSLLVFSVALMGFLFFYRPIVLIFENRRAEAVTFFLKTLGTFGALTLLVLTIVSFI